MATIMRTKIGDGLRDSEKLTPVKADYSEQALHTLSGETKYYTVVLQDMNNSHVHRRQCANLLALGRQVAEMNWCEEKIGNPASSGRWHDLPPLLYWQTFASKLLAIPSPARSPIEAIMEVTAYLTKRSVVSNEESSKAVAPLAEVAAPHAEAAARLAKRNEVIAAAFGLLKGKDVLPLDALQFEREMRDE